MSSQLVSEIKELRKERKSGGGKGYMKKLCSSLFTDTSYIGGIIMTLLAVAMIIIGALYFKRSVHCPPEPIALLLVILGSMMFLSGVLTILIRVTIDFIIDQMVEDIKEDIRDEISKKSSKSSKNEDAESKASEDPEPVKKKKRRSSSKSSKSSGKGRVYKKRIPTWVLVITNFIHILDLAIFATFIATCVFVYRHYAIVDYKNKNNTETYCDPTLYKFAFWTMNVIFMLIGLLILMCCCVGCLVLMI